MVVWSRVLPSFQAQNNGAMSPNVFVATGCSPPMKLLEFCTNPTTMNETRFIRLLLLVQFDFQPFVFLAAHELAILSFDILLNRSKWIL